MTQAQLSTILDQLQNAQEQHLIKNFVFVKKRLPQDPTYIYIQFTNTTTPEAKIELQDYFFKQYHTETLLINLGQILRVSVTP